MIATASARKTCRVFSAYVEETGEEYDMTVATPPLLPSHPSSLTGCRHDTPLCCAASTGMRLALSLTSPTLALASWSSRVLTALWRALPGHQTATSLPLLVRSPNQTRAPVNHSHATVCPTNHLLPWGHSTRLVNKLCDLPKGGFSSSTSAGL